VSSTVNRFQADAGRAATTHLSSLSSFMFSRQVPGIGRNDRGQLDTLDWESTQIEDRSYNANGLLTSIDRAFEDESRVYDDASQLTSISSNNTGSMSYTYDDNSNVLGETLSGAMAPQPH